jgi:hypothetical protein
VPPLGGVVPPPGEDEPEEPDAAGAPPEGGVLPPVPPTPAVSRGGASGPNTAESGRLQAITPSAIAP